MRVHTRVVVGVDGKVLEDEWTEYEGPVSFAGGSGGSSGKVSFPAYIENTHKNWLAFDGFHLLTTCISDEMQAAMGNSPYAALVAYDPDPAIATYLAEVADYEVLVDAMTGSLNSVDIAPLEITDAEILVDAAAHGALIDDQLISVVLPRFEAGMRDINAVVTSAFVIGRANLEDSRDHEIAKFAADLKMRSRSTGVERSDILLRWAMLRLEHANKMATLEIESERIKIVAKKEENDVLNELEVKDATWNLDLFQYGGNLMAAPGGGTAVTGSHKPSAAGSTLGGALSGAAMGATIGSSYPVAGTIIGGIVGGAAGFLSSL